MKELGYGLLIMVAVFLLYGGAIALASKEDAKRAVKNPRPLTVEFTPKGNPDYFCVLYHGAYSAGESSIMFCMPKKVSEE